MLAIYVAFCCTTFSNIVLHFVAMHTQVRLSEAHAKLMCRNDVLLSVSICSANRLIKANRNATGRSDRHHSGGTFHELHLRSW